MKCAYYVDAKSRGKEKISDNLLLAEGGSVETRLLGHHDRCRNEIPHGWPIKGKYRLGGGP